MEEILSSIRRIISEDEPDSKPPKAAEKSDVNGAGSFNGVPNGHDVTVAPPPADTDAPPMRLQANVDAGNAAGEAGPAPLPNGFGAPTGNEALTLDQPADSAAPEGFGTGFGAGFGTGFGGGFEDVADAAAETDEEVLDLTEMVASDGRVVKITPQGPSESGTDPSLDDNAVTQNGLDNTYTDAEPAAQNSGSAFGASFGQAAQAEVGAADEVSYAEADLNGTPAFMTAADTTTATAEEAEPFTAPAASADAFAELAGADEDENEQAMTQNATQEQAAPAQPGIGTDGFQNSGATTDDSRSAAAALSSGAAGLDAMVQKMAEPMVREWIEQNMQNVIEEIVREEVARRLSGG